MFHPIYINEGRLNNRNLSLYNEKQLNSTPKHSSFKLLIKFAS